MDRQPELFDEFREIQDKKRVAGKDIFPQRQFQFVLNYEKLILIALGAVVLLILIFVFGFECGKSQVVQQRPYRQIAQLSPQPPPQPPAPRQPVPQPMSRPPQPPPVKQPHKPYTIRVAAFKSKQYAQNEVEKLKKRGYSSTLAVENGLYILMVGEYANQGEAAAALNGLKKNYSDCAIRKR